MLSTNDNNQDISNSNKSKITDTQHHGRNNNKDTKPRTQDNATHKTWLRYALSLARHAPLKASNFRVGAVIVDPRLGGGGGDNDDDDNDDDDDDDDYNDLAKKQHVMVDGYTGALGGNEHAEGCCLVRLEGMLGDGESKAEGKGEGEESGNASKGKDEKDKDKLKHTTPTTTTTQPQPQLLHLYTTMEPCWRRLSGAESCTDLIVRWGPGAVGAEESAWERSSESDDEKGGSEERVEGGEGGGGGEKEGERNRKRKNAKVMITHVFYGLPEPDTFVGSNKGMSGRKLAAGGVESVYVKGMEEEILRVAKAGHTGGDAGVGGGGGEK